MTDPTTTTTTTPAAMATLETSHGMARATPSAVTTTNQATASATTTASTVATAAAEATLANTAEATVFGSTMTEKGESKRTSEALEQLFSDLLSRCDTLEAQLRAEKQDQVSSMTKLLEENEELQRRCDELEAQQRADQDLLDYTKKLTRDNEELQREHDGVQRERDELQRRCDADNKQAQEAAHAKHMLKEMENLVYDLNALVDDRDMTIQELTRSAAQEMDRMQDSARAMAERMTEAAVAHAKEREALLVELAVYKHGVPVSVDALDASDASDTTQSISESESESENDPHGDIESDGQNDSEPVATASTSEQTAMVMATPSRIPPPKIKVPLSPLRGRHASGSASSPTLSPAPAPAQQPAASAARSLLEPGWACALAVRTRSSALAPDPALAPVAVTSRVSETPTTTSEPTTADAMATVASTADATAPMNMAQNNEPMNTTEALKQLFRNLVRRCDDDLIDYMTTISEENEALQCLCDELQRRCDADDKQAEEAAHDKQMLKEMENLVHDFNAMVDDRDMTIQELTRSTAREMDRLQDLILARVASTIPSTETSGRTTVAATATRLSQRPAMVPAAEAKAKAKAKAKPRWC